MCMSCWLLFDQVPLAQTMILATIWALSTTARQSRQRQVSFLGYQTSGKPPPESAACILASEALKRVKQSPTNPALLITDGAPCYRSLSAKFGWWHEACNHSKGIFCIKKRMKNKRILIHAGGVDSMWRLLDQPFHVALRPG